jgi:hypothetical protein
VTGVYVGGLPVAAGFVASQTEFDLGAVVLSAVRWRRTGGRFLPGAGRCAGYAVLADHDDRGGVDGPLQVLDSELWGAP